VFEKNLPDKEFEKLSKAITEAILNSKDVKKIIAEIREKDLFTPNSLMVMVLKLESLSAIRDCLNDAMEEDLDTLTEPPNKKKEKTYKHYIDGKELDSSEIAFQEFLIKKFNQKKWLKKNRLIF